MSEEELYKQYLAEVGGPQKTAPPTDPLYAQYLAETGQAAAPKAAAGPQDEKFNNKEAALQGFGSGATFGYLPRMQAATEAALSHLPGQETVTYAQALPQWQKRENAIAQEHPLSYLGGSFAGGAMVPIPGTGAIKTGGILAKTAKAAGQGAAIAALSDPNQGDIGSENDLKARLERAKSAGEFAGGLQFGGSSLASLGDKQKSYGVLKLLGAKGKDAEKLIENNKAGLKKAEQFMDQEGIVGPLTTSSDVAKRSEAIANKTGKQIGDAYDKAQAESLNVVNQTKQVPIQTAPVDVPTGRKVMKGYDLVDETAKASPLQYETKIVGPAASTPEQAAKVQSVIDTKLNAPELADKFIAKAKDDFAGVANGDRILGQLKAQVNNLRKVKQPGIEGIIEFRKSLDDALKKTYEKPMADVTDKQEAMMALRRYLKDQTNEHINALDNLVGSQATKDLKVLNDRFSNAQTIKRIAGKAVMAHMRNRPLDLAEEGAALGALGYGVATGDERNAGKALGVVAAHRLGRTFGPALLYKAGGALNRAPSLPIRPALAPWMLMDHTKGENK